MPRVRFTIRRMMIAVAIAAAVLGGWTMWGRSKRFAGMSRDHAREAARWFDAARWLREGYGIPEPTAPSLALRERRHAWHAELARKYEHAARLPWLPVAPDPPEPE